MEIKGSWFTRRVGFKDPKYSVKIFFLAALVSGLIVLWVNGLPEVCFRESPSLLFSGSFDFTFFIVWAVVLLSFISVGLVKRYKNTRSGKYEEFGNPYDKRKRWSLLVVMGGLVLLTPFLLQLSCPYSYIVLGKVNYASFTGCKETYNQCKSDCPKSSLICMSSVLECEREYENCLFPE